MKQRVGGRRREKKGGAPLLLAHRCVPKGRVKRRRKLKRINIMFPHNYICTSARAAPCSNFKLDLGEHICTLRMQMLTIVGAFTPCGFGPFICADIEFSHKVEKIPYDDQTLSNVQTKPPETTLSVCDQ